ncbi:unnamed protein product [Owenia fusiformis]|uniref:Uncharacterized protein n=1 Tax=Owenia fusiformis TaxID=6347 RepID=A0A8S4NHQ3_OWEFU|nr:unnamed protein product [Owenia fusiformis]
MTGCFIALVTLITWLAGQHRLVHANIENALAELKPVVAQLQAEFDQLEYIFYHKISETPRRKLHKIKKEFILQNDITRPLIRYIKDKANAFMQDNLEEGALAEVYDLSTDIVTNLERLKATEDVKSEDADSVIRDIQDGWNTLSELPYFADALEREWLLNRPDVNLERLAEITSKSLMPDLERIKKYNKENNLAKVELWEPVASLLGYYLKLATKEEAKKKSASPEVKKDLRAMGDLAKEAKDTVSKLLSPNKKQRKQAMAKLERKIEKLTIFNEKSGASSTPNPPISGDSTPNQNGDTTPNPDDSTTPNPNSDTTPNQDGDTTPNQDSETTPNPNSDTTPNQDGDTTQNPDGNTTQNPDDSTNPNPNGDTTPNPDGDTTPNPDGDTTPNPDGDTTPQPTTEIALPDTLPSLDGLFKFKSFEFTKALKVKDGCSVTLASDGCVISITPNPDTCLTVDVIIEKVLNTINGIAEALQIGSVGENPIDMSALIVKYFDINVCDETGSLSVSLFADREITIIPSVLSVTNIEIDLSIILPTKSLRVSFSATWDLGGVSFVIQAGYDNGEYDVVARPVSSDVSLATLLGTVSNAVIPGDSTSASSLFNQLKFNDISISDMSLVAKFTDFGMGVQFSFTSTVSGLGSTNIMLNFNRLREGSEFNNGFSLAALLKDLTFASIIQHLANYDISSVPLIGTLAFPEVAVIGATKEIPLLIVDYNSDSNVIALLPSVSKGITLLFSARFDANSDPMNFMVTFTPPKSIGFKVLPGPQLDIESIINKLLDSINLELPPGFPLASFLNRGLSNMNYNGDLNELTIPVILEDDITIVEHVFEIEEPQVEFVIGLSKPRTLSFQASGTWLIRDYPIELTISKPSGASEFLASACSERPLEVGKVMAKFAASFLPDFVADAFQTFSIENPCFEVLIGKNFGARVSGTAVIGNFDASKVEVLGGKVNGAMLMTLGVVLERTKLSSVIDKLTKGKVDISSIPGSRIFDESSIGFVTSTHEIPSIGRSDLRFKLPMLGDTNILDGVSLVAEIKLPEDCSGDIVCGVFKKFGLDFTLIIKGRLAINDLLLEVTIPRDIEIVQGFNLSGIGFRVIVRPPMVEVALIASLKIDEPKLSFSGAIGFSTTGGATLGMAMVGCWTKPFTIPILRICDLNIKIGITPEPTLISELHLGGRAQIGKIDDPDAKLFNASLYIGLNKIVPSESYFSGKISSLTIPAVLAAFAYFPTLPQALNEIGFPDALDVSYSQFGKVLPNGVTIPSGVRFNGTLQILGFKVHSTMRLDINGIYILVMVDRFDIGNNLISIDGDGKSGPELLVDVGWNPPRATIDIQGKVCVLKICASVNITIDKRGIHFEIGGSFLNLFEAQLNITANYASLATAKFSVAGSFKQTLLENLKNKVTGAINDLSKKATAAFDAAERELNSAKETLRDAADDLRNKKADVDKIQAKINAKAQEIGNQQSNVDNLEREWKEKVQDARDKVEKLNAAKREITDLQNRIESGERICPGGCKRRRRRNLRRGIHIVYNRKTYTDLLRGVRLDDKSSKSFLHSRTKRVYAALANRAKARDKRFLGIEFNPLEPARELAERAREETFCAAKEAARATCLLPFKTMRVTLEGVKGGLSGLQWAADSALKVAQEHNVLFDAAKGTLIVLEKVMEGLAESMNAAKGLMDAAAFLVEKSTNAVTGAQLALDGVNEAQKAGLKAASFITRLTLGGIINIKEISFNVELAVANTGEFGGTIVVSFLGRSDDTFSFQIKLYSIESMVGILVDKVKDLLNL